MGVVPDRRPDFAPVGHVHDKCANGVSAIIKSNGVFALHSCILLKLVVNNPSWWRSLSVIGITSRSIATATSPAVRRRGALSTSTRPKRPQIAPWTVALERYRKTAGGSSVRVPVITTCRSPNTLSAPAITAAVASSASTNHGAKPSSSKKLTKESQLGLACGTLAAKV